jgi:hypothetical protein
MNNGHVLSTFAILLATILPAQSHDGSAGSPTPQGGGSVVPAAWRNAMGPSVNTQIPLSSASIRYQQVFLGSELPPAQPILGLGLRQDDVTIGGVGYAIDVEMDMGYTTFDHTNLGTTFASNFNVTPPAKVLRRANFNLPSLTGTNADPSLFRIQIPFSTPFPFVRTPGNNVLLEIVVWGNGNNNQVFTYPLDSVASRTTIETTSRVYAVNNPTATSGIFAQYQGLIVCMLDRIGTIGDYSLFGQGCQGTGGKAGVVVPATYRNQWGESNNYYPHGKSNMRYQQVFLGSEMPSANPLIGVAMRQDDVSTGRVGGASTLRIDIGYTTYDHSNLTNSFAGNYNAGAPPTTVLSGNVNLPTLSGVNTDLGNFATQMPFTVPFPYAPMPGRNLVIEIVNTSTADILTFFDATNGAGATTTRIYDFNATSQTAGTVARSFGLVMCFLTPGAGSSNPRLSVNGRPVVNRSYDVELAEANKVSVAILFTGSSDQNAGGIPLPFDLAAVGAPGCKLLVSLQILLTTPTDQNGLAKVTLPLPNDKSLIGAKLFQQWAVVDPSANALGLAWSEGGKGTIGEQ